MSLELGTDKTKEYFEYDAHRFADNRWLGSRVACYDYLVTKKLLLEALNLNPQDRVLEIGCGPGVWTSILARKVDGVKAIDISSNMIKEAQSRATNENVIFEISDFLQYKDDQRYDKIASVRVIEYIPDRAVAIGKMYDLLKPGGRIVIITKTRSSLFTIRSRLWNFLLTTLRVKKERGITEPEIMMLKIGPRELKKLFSLCGFSYIEVSPVILRLPWFFRGRYFLPFEPLLFKFCNVLAERSHVFPPPLTCLLFFFSESYLLEAKK